MKLRKIIKGVKEVKDNQCCRWCHYFNNGVCYNEKVCSIEVERVSDFLYYSEEGYIVDIIRESLYVVPLKDFSELFDKLSEWKISEKRKREFEQLFQEVFEEWVDLEISPKIDEALCKFMNKPVATGFDCVGVAIENPESFSCREWC